MDRRTEEHKARVAKRAEDSRRFQLARDLLVAMTDASAVDYRSVEQALSAGDFAAQVAVLRADRLLELLAEEKAGPIYEPSLSPADQEEKNRQLSALMEASLNDRTRAPHAAPEAE